MATLAGQLALNARRHPDRIALVFGDRERTYRELDADIDRYAHALLSLQIAKGDRVAVLSPNSDRFLLALYAAYRVGAIAVPLNPRVTTRELHYLLTDSGASVLLFGGDTAGAVRGLAQMDDPSSTRILSLDGTSGFENFDRIAATMPADPPTVEVAEDDDCMIIYTSGTTGAPKGALFDHHRMLWVGHSMSALGMNSFDRNLHVAPVVPTMYQMMLTLPDLTTRDLSAWRLGFFGAAPMPPSAAAKLVTTLPHVGFFQLCGQTEGGPTGIYSTPEEVKARPDATGRWAITNAEVRLVDSDGNDVGIGETGEMIVRGETLMKGYWNNPEATAATLRDGWLHSGDLAVRDADGYITIVDRLKDMIITGGRNVYSVEVENALAAHPDVRDVAIVSRPDETFGETIVAVVTPAEGRTVTLDDLRTFAAEYVSDYKLPRDLVLREIPRNPSGKILKHILREQVRAS